MRQQQGSILVFVVLTVAVLMIYGVTFATATVAEYRAAMHHTQGVQAFNLAEAGLNWARRGLQNRAFVPPSAVGERTVTPPPGTFDDIGQIQVWIRRITVTTTVTPGLLELRAEGRQGQARRTVSILVNETAGFPPEDVLTRHQVVGAVSLRDGARLEGDISGGSFTSNSFSRITGTAIVGPPLASFAAPAFSLPTGLTDRPDVVVRDGSAPLPGSGIYHRITVEDGGVLVINVPDANDVIIQVGTLTLRDNARINVNRSASATGRILLHVTQNIQLEDGVRVNNHGYIERFILYYHGTTAVSMQDNVHFTGIMVTNTPSVTISDRVVLTGHLITGGTSLVIEDNAVITGVVYAPRAAANIQDNVRINGLVMAGALNLEDAVRVTYATGGFASFTPMVPALGLWPTAASYSFHTWGSR